MKNIKSLLIAAVSAASIILFSTTAKAAPYENERFSFQQPDKSLVDVVSTGDEFFQHTESTDGYTLIRNDEGWICYAKLNEEGNKLIATDTVYNGTNEAPSYLDKHIEVNQESVDKQVEEGRKELDADSVTAKKSSLFNTKTASTNTNIKGLTVIVDFPDQPGTMAKSQVEDYFNKVGYKTFGNNGSVHDYFYDISSGAMNYTNKVVGYYRAKHNKSDYDKSTYKCGTAAGMLIEEIEEWIKNNNIDISDVTKNSNGSLKMLNIFYAGSRSAGWDKGLWPHRFSRTFMGKSQQYQISDMTDELKLGTVCHETGHALLNYPDMYRCYNDAGQRESGPSLVGDYCLMGTGGHKSGSKNPTPPNPYLRYYVSKFPNKVRELNSVSIGSSLSLNSSSKGDAWVYRWKNTSNSSEYLLLENIQNSGRYAGLGESGIVIWHINTAGSNSKPINQKYLVTIVEADGKDDLLKGTRTRTDLFNSNNKININETTAPNAKWYDGTYSGLNLNSVSYSDSSMTFKVGPGIKGFFETLGHKYFIDNYGEKATGWNIVVSDGNKYYFDKTTGEAYKGWNTISGRKYYFDNNGVYKKELSDISVTGNYSTVETGEVKKQAKLNKQLRLRVTPIGGNANCEFSFSVSYKAVSAPAENFGPYSANVDGISKDFYYTPNHLGLCAINITVKEGDKTVTQTLYVNVVK